MQSTRHHSWASALEHHPHFESLNAKAEEILAVMSSSESPPSKLRTLSDLAGCASLSFNSLGKLRILHHHTKIGVQLLGTKQHVALLGLGPTASALVIDPSACCSVSGATNVPTWDALLASTEAAGFKSLKPPKRSAPSAQISSMVALPPRVAVALGVVDLGEPEDVAISILDLLRSLDAEALADGESVTPSAAYEALLNFLWHYGNSATRSPLPCAPSVDSPVQLWASEMHSRHLTPLAPASQGSSGNPDMSGMITEMASLTQEMRADRQLHRDFKEAKSPGFSRLSPLSQKTFLFAASTSVEAHPSVPPQALVDFLKARTTADAHAQLSNQVQRQDGCRTANLPPSLAASIHTGQICGHSPSALTGFSPLCCPGYRASSLDPVSEETMLALNVKGREGKLSDADVHSLVQRRAHWATSVNSLRQTFKITGAVCKVISGAASILSLAITGFSDHMDEHEHCYMTLAFKSPSFVRAVQYRAHFNMQKFLISCRNAETIDEVDFRALDFAPFFRDIEMEHWPYQLPAALLLEEDRSSSTSSSHSNPDGESSKKRRRRANLVVNEDQVPAWKLRPKESYNKVFHNKKCDAKPPKIGDLDLCKNWAFLGSCSPDCPRSHKALKPGEADYKKVDEYVAKCRLAAPSN